MTAALIYCRLSKDGAGDRLGVDRQERLCRTLADRSDLTVIDVLVDNDLSAYAGKRRPAFESLVRRIRAGEAGAVVTYHADRLYRRTTDLERLVDLVETSRAQVHTVAAGNVDLTTASGRMVARMLGAAAQHEVERMGERLRAKMDELAARGDHPGGRPPFGYDRGYLVNPAEAEAVRTMARRVLEGASLLRVARELDAADVSTREGGRWHHSSVRTALLNPAVAALRVHRREVAGPGNWEAVLPRSTYEAVRAVLADPARKRKRPARRYLLVGLVTTPNGDPMTGRPDRGTAGVRDRRCYATRSPATPSLSVGADDLETLIVEVVLASLDRSRLPLPTPSCEGVGVEVVEAELAELAQLRGSGTISLAEWMAARAPLLARLEAATSAAAAVRSPTAALRLLDEPGAVRKAWPGLDFHGRREIISTVIERIVVGPAPRGRWTPLAERLSPEAGGRIVWRA